MDAGGGGARGGGARGGGARGRGAVGGDGLPPRAAAGRGRAAGLSFSFAFSQKYFVPEISHSSRIESRSGPLFRTWITTCCCSLSQATLPAEGAAAQPEPESRALYALLQVCITYAVSHVVLRPECPRRYCYFGDMLGPGRRGVIGREEPTPQCFRTPTHYNRPVLRP